MERRLAAVLVAATIGVGFLLTNLLLFKKRTAS